MAVRSDVSSLLKLGEDRCRTHAFKDKLKREAVDLLSQIEEQAETVSCLQNPKEELERETGNVCVHIQAQMESVGRLERDAETAAATSVVLAGNQAAYAMLPSDPHLL